MDTADSQRILQELRTVPVIGDLPEETLNWLATRLTEVKFEAGEVLVPEGAPADTFFILMEGDLQFRRESDPQETRSFYARPGEIGGKLPFSRLKNYFATLRAATSGRLLRASTDIFPAMIHDVPQLVERLVGIMSDRIRWATKEDQQRDKLAALGKLSAGLAHELNNPAAAAKRAARALSEAQETLFEATSRLDVRKLSDDQRKAIAVFEREALEHSQSAPVVDALTQSDQEDVLAEWLQKYEVQEDACAASILAEVSLDIPWLEKLRLQISGEALGDALMRIVSQILAKRLTKEIESSTGRISDLVKAIKEYSYMDQAPFQEIDVHHGIENTLVMLGYKLKHGIAVERIYDKSLPPIHANGSELNQVWTNLIDNAADAMKGGGKLTIRTSLDRDCVVVDIVDSGAGIPEDIQGRVFDPFFTTKQMGQGTGLGLDMAYRIVRKHHGDISVESEPGNTRFIVRLPLKQPARSEQV